MQLCYGEIFEQPRFPAGVALPHFAQTGIFREREDTPENEFSQREPDL